MSTVDNKQRQKMCGCMPGHTCPLHSQLQQKETGSNAAKAGFRQSARRSPAELVAQIESGALEPASLTYAAEALGELADSAVAVPCLLPLLDHPSSVVREGAIYGLERHLKAPGVEPKLRELAEKDPQEGVREAAKEALS